MEKQPVPFWGWVSVLAIVALLGVIAVLDWIDGATAEPSTYLLGCLAAIAGLALGIGPPFSGGGKSNA